MNLLIAATVGVLFAAGVFCLLRRCLMRLIIGLVLMGQGVNLLVFSAGGLETGVPTIVPEGGKLPPPGAGDPMPQALVLTAIVIGFGLTVFAMTLIHRARATSGNDDVDAFNQTDQL
jgi:multicomponent Na+:H+ antiporter subunit C